VLAEPGTRIEGACQLPVLDATVRWTVVVPEFEQLDRPPDGWQRLSKDWASYFPRNGRPSSRGVIRPWGR